MTAKDLTSLTWFVRHRLSMLLGQELIKILSENKNSWLGKWILPRETSVALLIKTWGFQTSCRTLVNLRIKRKQGKKSRCQLPLYESVTKKSSIKMKRFLLWSKLSISKMRVYAHSTKEARELVPRIKRSHYPASVMVWWGGITSLNFCEGR